MKTAIEYQDSLRASRVAIAVSHIIDASMATSFNYTIAILDNAADERPSPMPSPRIVMAALPSFVAFLRQEASVNFI